MKTLFVLLLAIFVCIGIITLCQFKIMTEDDNKDKERASLIHKNDSLQSIINRVDSVFTAYDHYCIAIDEAKDNLRGKSIENLDRESVEMVWIEEVREWNCQEAYDFIYFDVLKHKR